MLVVAKQLVAIQSVLFREVCSFVMSTFEAMGNLEARHNY